MTEVANPSVRQFENLIDQSEGYDRLKGDYRLAARDLSFDHDGKLVVVAPPLPYDDATYQSARMKFDTAPKDTRTVDLTDNSRSQLYSKLGPVHYGKGSSKSLPGEYLEKLPNSLRADVLNWTLERSTTAWKVRLYEDTCRAIVSGEYPRIWNTEILRQLSRVLKEKNGLDGLHLDRPWVTPDSLGVRIWWDGSATGNYHIGAQFGNEESGNGSFVARPMIRRTSCANSIVVSDVSALTGARAGFQLTHYVGASAEAMMTQFYAQLPALMNASAALVNRMIEAEAVALPDFRMIIDGLRLEHGWTPAFTNLVDEGTEGQRTLAGIVNGVTYAAHADRGLSEAEGLELEVMGGGFLTAKPVEFTRLAKIGFAGKKS